MIYISIGDKAFRCLCKGNDLHCCNSGRGPSEISQPALQNCPRIEECKDINLCSEMFPNQIDISNLFFSKNIILKADQQGYLSCLHG